MCELQSCAGRLHVARGLTTCQACRCHPVACCAHAAARDTAAPQGLTAGQAPCSMQPAWTAGPRGLCDWHQAVWGVGLQSPGQLLRLQQQLHWTALYACASCTAYHFTVVVKNAVREGVRNPVSSAGRACQRLSWQVVSRACQTTDSIIVCCRGEGGCSRGVRSLVQSAGLSCKMPSWIPDQWGQSTDGTALCCCSEGGGS